MESIKENEWIVNEFNTRRFHHAGWTITLWGHTPVPDIDSPHGGDVEVCVGPDGIECFGEHSNGYSFSGARFTIPWRIITELALLYKES